MSHTDLHARMPALNTQLKEFVRSSKAFVRVTATPSATFLTSTFKGKDLLLEDYGVYMHMSAITAELCIAPEVNSAVHSMLTQMRRAKYPSGDAKLKASFRPLTRLELWVSFVGKAPHTLPQQVSIQHEPLHQAISSRGERGDGRDLKPDSLLLSCPHCTAHREAARSTLYTVLALGLNCPSCKRNTTSTR